MQSRSYEQQDELNAFAANWPALYAYLARVGCNKMQNFRSHAIQEIDEDSRYWRDLVRVKIERDGAVGVKAYPRSASDEIDPSQFEPTPEEAEAIKAEVAAKPFPKSIPGDDQQLPPQLIGVDPSEYFVFRNKDDGELVDMIQWRKIDDQLNPYYLPFSMWSDGKWRMMEPEGPLPLFGLERLKRTIAGKRAPWQPKYYIMIHEGAKCARHVQGLVENKTPHPWLDELSRYTHLGWPGGVNSADRVNWETVKKMELDRRIILVCDNDLAGINVASSISRLLQRPLLQLKFDSRFPESFDLADDWPTGERWHAKWWDKDGRYRGPRLEEFLFSATWATAVKRKSKGAKGKPGFKIVDMFAKEWNYVEDLDVFIHQSQWDRMLKREVFNSSVRPFSDVKDTAALFVELSAPNAGGVAYEPGQSPGVINLDGRRLVNMYRPSGVAPIAGDPGPFVDFFEHLFPSERDRKLVMRWCVTLVARPDIHMRYALLLISLMQGVGKGTLAWILARLVGEHNVSYPTEHMIVDNQFTGWIARKRLSIVHEIYSGQSRKGYDRLKDKITDDTVTVNEKYIPAHVIRSWAHILACSNSLRPIHLDDVDRRWLVPTVTEELREQRYWEELYDWLAGDGLGVTLNHLVELAKDPSYLVSTSEHAPMTSAKEQVIADSRSIGEQIAHDLGEMVAQKSEKIVLTVEEVRMFVAVKRGLVSLNDHKLEKAYTLRRALLKAGLREPRVAAGERPKRYKVNLAMQGWDTHKTYVAANFEIELGAEWDDIKQYRKNPDDLWNI
jgi:hypothetical protein